MSQAYVVGLGSPHGWDRLGWLAVERLARDLAGRPDLTLAALAQPGELFLYPVTAEDRLLVIDAMHDDGAMGALHVCSPAALPAAGTTLSSHGLDLPGLLALVASLGLCGRGIRIIGLGVPRPGADAAPVALDDALARRLEGEVRAWLEGSGERLG